MARPSQLEEIVQKRDAQRSRRDINDLASTFDADREKASHLTIQHDKNRSVLVLYELPFDTPDKIDQL